MKYIVLSPVGDHRTKWIDEFIDALKAQTIPPDEIVLCVDLDTNKEIERDDVKFLYSPEIGISRSQLDRICTAREILRNYFIYGKYDFALWVDSDIIVPPELAETLYQVMETRQALIVVNQYQGRSGPESRWSGSGVMLTHRVACTASHFWVGRIIDKHGVEKHLSEDLMFFSIIDQGSRFIKRWSGRSGRICKEFVIVSHRSVEFEDS